MESVMWRKATYSDANGGNCVEVAPGMIRDSKDPNGPRLRVGARGLARLVADIKADRITR